MLRQLKPLTLLYLSTSTLLLIHTSLLAAAPAMAAFIELPSKREFTGQMIARPIQLKSWAKRGLMRRDAYQHMEHARAIIEAYDVKSHLSETDEYIIRVPDGSSEDAIAQTLMATGVFQYIEPNWRLWPVACPNDPQVGSQYHHSANSIQSYDAWEIHTGDPSVAVGICDTGIRTTHQDLQLNRLEGYNAVDQVHESDGGIIEDVNGHGTLATGCAAANGDNGTGISGVGWHLSHRMLKVSNNSNGSTYLSTLLRAARKSAELGDRVVSVSYSGAETSSVRTTATYLKSKGSLLFWAAGNEGEEMNTGPRDNDDVIVVGATDSSDNLAYFSNYGQYVDLVAPGVNILSTGRYYDSSYQTADGTSFACPLAAGLAALIWSLNPALSPDEVEQALKDGCDDLGDPGVDDRFGYGRINAYRSLSIVQAGLQTSLAQPAKLSWRSFMAEVMKPYRNR